MTCIEIDMYESVVSVDVYIQLSQYVHSDLSSECMLWQSAATSFIYSLSFYDGDRNPIRHFAS